MQKTSCIQKRVQWLRRYVRFRFTSICLILLCCISGCTGGAACKFGLAKDERVWLEKFFRYLLFYERGIYTLVGSKPLISVSLFYFDLPEEELRLIEREERCFFLLNRQSAVDRDFYRNLSKEEREKALLIRDSDFIHDFDKLWLKWEKNQHRFPLKKDIFF